MSSTKVDIWNRALDRIGETDTVDSEEEASGENPRAAAAACDRHYDSVLKLVLEARVWKWALRQRILALVNEQAKTTAYADATSYTTFDVTYAFLDSAQVEVVHISAAGAESTLVEDDDYTVTPADPDADTNAQVVLGTPIGVGESVRITVTTTRVGWENVYGLPGDCVKPTALLYGDMRRSLLPHSAELEFAVLPNDAGDGFLLCCDVGADDFDALEYVALLDTVAMWPAHFEDAVVARLAMELALSIKKDRALWKECKQDYIEAIDAASAVDQNVGTDSVEPVSPSLAARE